MSDPITRLNAALEHRYHIERELGEGGMATVYLARDERHNRNVALKVLKPELAAMVGAERFLAEIRTTANLQHPHILPLFDSGEVDSFLFYVMPFVEGESLRDRLDREHLLPVDDAVRIAEKVAEGLDYAHRQGVVHRDIKPANILLQDGEPVLSDFGIALAAGIAGGGRLTETGLSLGTPHYMSPEQATGELNVGAATDIYALGCVLYEMLVGEPPYTGSTAQAVLGKIIQAPPVSATESRPTVPAHVDAVIGRALEKVPADRFTAARDLAEALGNPAFRHGGAAPQPGADAVRRWRRIAAASGALALLFGVGLVGSLGREPAGPATQRIRLEPPVPLSAIGAVDFAPDGSRFVFARPDDPDASDGPREWRLWIQAWDGRDPTPIVGTQDAGRPAISPDGRRVAFVSEGSLKVVDLGGGGPVTLRDSLFFVSHIDWASDGFIYLSSAFTGRPTVVRIPEGGGEVEPATAAEDGVVHLQVEALPDGRGILFVLRRGLFDPSNDSIGVLDLVSGEQRTLLPGSTPAYSPTGHLVYRSSADQLMAVPFDLGTLTVGATPAIMEESAIRFALSPSGDLMFVEGALSPRVPEVVWIDRNGVEEAIDWAFGPGDSPTDLALSPDGTRLALSVFANDTLRLRVKDLVGGTVTDLGHGLLPGWSDDGREIAYRSARVDGRWRLWRRRWDGSGRPVPITGPLEPAQLDMGHWWPDRAVVIGTSTGLSRLGPGGDSIPVPLVEAGAALDNPTVSPDGRWVAFEMSVGEEDRVFVRPMGADTALHAISLGSGREPRWSPDGTELFYSSRPDGSGTDVMSARIRTAPTFAVVERSTLFRFQNGYQFWNDGWLWDVSPDGRRFVVVRLGSPEVEQRHLVLVRNFAEELKRRVPVR